MSVVKKGNILQGVTYTRMWHVDGQYGLSCNLPVKLGRAVLVLRGIGIFVVGICCDHRFGKIGGGGGLLKFGLAFCPRTPSRVWVIRELIIMTVIPCFLYHLQDFLDFETRVV